MALILFPFFAEVNGSFEVPHYLYHAICWLAFFKMSQSADVSFIGEDDSEYFRRLFDRTFNNLNTRYLLPADEDEVKVSVSHKAMKCSMLNSYNLVVCTIEV